MAIIVAIQRGTTVYAYGENNRILFMKKGDLQGYTASTVSIKWGSTIYTYNEKGGIISSHVAG